MSEAVKTDHAEISIIGNNNIISKPGIIDLGYKFKFTPGWHTYWINPGDSGAHQHSILQNLMVGKLMKTNGLVLRK